MFVRIFLLLFFYILWSGCGVVFSTRVVVDLRLSGKVLYVGVPKPAFKDFCSYAIEEIYKNSEGQKLIDKISALLMESSIQEVRFLDSSGSGGGTAFVHGLDFNAIRAMSGVPDNVLNIHINLDNATRCISPGTEWCGQLFGISECVYDFKTIDKVGGVFRIARMFAPFYVTIAHEFIHLKHFLETLLHKGDNSYVTYGDAVNIATYMQIIADPRLHTLPELGEREYVIKRLIPWDNFEERRTVVGPDIDGISELSFRIAGGLPIRYIYQGLENCFYEDPEILYAIVKKALFHQNPEMTIEEVKDQVKYSLPEGYLSEQGIDFVRFSGYHPLTVKLALFNNAQIIENTLPPRARASASAFLTSRRLIVPKPERVVAEVEPHIDIL